MPRLQDVLFGALAMAVIILTAYDLSVVVLAFVGALLCGCLFLIAGMIQARTEAFWGRLATTMFLAVVLSCIVLIVPGAFGANRSDLRGPELAIAALLPVAALCFEVVRTPRLMRTVLRSLGRR